ncbi:MAG: hypothetical protein ACTSRZ_14090 [Promethearchaeota archaeon]
MEEDFKFTRKGFAGFIYLSLFHMLKVGYVKDELKKRDARFNLIIECEDFTPAVLISFKNKNIYVYGIDDLDIQHKIQWDAKLIAPSEIITNFFIGNLGVFKPLLLRKIKAKKMFKLMKLTWYIKLCIKFYGTNKAYGLAVYRKMKKHHDLYKSCK